MVQSLLSSISLHSSIRCCRVYSHSQYRSNKYFLEILFIEVGLKKVFSFKCGMIANLGIRNLPLLRLASVGQYPKSKISSWVGSISSRNRDLSLFLIFLLNKYGKIIKMRYLNCKTCSQINRSKANRGRSGMVKA